MAKSYNRPALTVRAKGHVKARKQAVPKRKTTSNKPKWLLVLQEPRLWIGILATVAVALSSVYGWDYLQKEQMTAQEQREWMPMRYLEIQGELVQVDKQEILGQLIREPDTGYLSTDLETMEVSIESLPWIRDAELRRVWPDKLQLKIEEQEAIARWNETDLVNKYGVLFSPEQIDGMSNLPHLEGPEGELENLLMTYKSIQSHLKEAGLNAKRLTLNHRRAWSVDLTNGIHLEVGRQHLMQRIERFITLYPMLREESLEPIETVDLRYDTGLAVMRSQSIADQMN